MKLAITMTPGNGRISPVFETAEHLLTVRLCRSGKYTVIAGDSLPADESEKIIFLRDLGVRSLICGAVCNETLKNLRTAGIQVVPFVSGEWHSVVDAALNHPEDLPADFIMPGCCRHHRKCCQNQGAEKNENRTDLSR